MMLEQVPSRAAIGKTAPAQQPYAVPERLATLHADKHHCMAAIWSQQLSHEKHVRLLEDFGALLW